MSIFFNKEIPNFSKNVDEMIVLSRKDKLTGDAYGLLIDVGHVLKGAGATGPRSYGVAILGDKEEGVLTTAGCDDALFQVQGNNYVANAEIFNFRGINILVRNRDGGVLGELDNLISVATKSGSTTATVIALKLDNEHMSADNPDELGGLDIALCREGGAATKEYGIKIRTRGSVNTAVAAALRVEKGTDYGFSRFLDVDAAASLGIEAATGDTAHDANDVVIPIKIGTSTYYIVAQDSKG